MICINCGTEDTGKMCSNCGQPLEVKRITLAESWGDFWDKMYGFDSKFLRTVRDATTKPGVVAREFIRGNRVRYFGPVGYYFFMITVFLLVLSMIDLSYADYLKAMQEELPMQQQSNTKLGESTRNWVADNLKLIAFLIPPFMAFASQRIFFRKQGLNFIEHSVPVFYILGHWYWISTIEAVIFKYTGKAMGSAIQLILVSLYLAFGYTTFVQTQPKWKVFLKGIGTYLVGYVLMFIFAGLVGVVIGLLLAWLDPEMFNSIRPSQQNLPK